MGWGGDDNVQVIRSKTDLRILKTKGWGGVGWGGDDNVQVRGHNRDRVRGHN